MTGPVAPEDLERAPRAVTHEELDEFAESVSRWFGFLIFGVGFAITVGLGALAVALVR